MKVQFFHLGEHFSSQLAPETNLNVGKFVQIVHAELGEFILFAPKELCTFHAQIVDLFSTLQKPQWAFEINPKRDDGVMHEEGVTIVGGGHYEIIGDRHRLNLTGQSLAFGDYEAYGLEEKIRSVSRFKAFRVYC